jgi:hypothetical protein
MTDLEEHKAARAVVFRVAARDGFESATPNDENV